VADWRTDVAKLTALREAKGLSIRKLACQSTVSDSWLRLVFQGVKDLGPITAPRVAAALDCTVEDFTYHPDDQAVA
jgi:transcriptional regulator with XRE-family HTH domain